MSSSTSTAHTTHTGAAGATATKSSKHNRPIDASGTFSLGDLRIHRLGFGAMRLTGDGIWGPPKSHDESIRVLRRAVELGVDFIDTADAYGPYISEELIHEALHPYPHGLVIATKAGLLRTGPNEWIPLGNPTYLRQECEMSRRRLGVDTIDLFQLHRIDPNYPTDDQFLVLKKLQDEGKVRHIGLSEVTVDQVKAARRIVPIVSVQNEYNLVNRKSEAVLDYCEAEGIGFIPWFPVASGKLAQPGGIVDKVVKETNATPAQVALAWLLRRSEVMLPIPGTSSVAHLEENCGAAQLDLTNKQFVDLNNATR
jgi:pyridoxine 4-dehydrogenase